jgi:hypothetical protein
MTLRSMLEEVHFLPYATVVECMLIDDRPMLSHAFIEEAYLLWFLLIVRLMLISL